MTHTTSGPPVKKLGLAYYALMATKEIAVRKVIFVITSTISPSLSNNVISLTDVDFDDRVFGSSTHFVIFYGPW